MSTTIESLEVEIQSNSTSAADGVDALASSLGKLKNAVKGGSGLTSLSNQLTKLDSILNNVSESSALKMGKLADGLSAISSVGNTKISSSIATQINKIGDAMNNLPLSGVEKLEDTAKAIGQLSGLGSVQLPTIPATPVETVAPATPAITPASVGSGSNGIADAVGEVTRYTDSAKEATSVSQRLKSIVGTVGGVFAKGFSGVGKVLSSVKSGLTKVASGAKTAFNGIKNLASSLKDKLAPSFAKGTSKAGQFLTSLKRIALYRAVRAMLSALTAGMKEGINNLYQYSKAFDGTFSQSLDRCATSFLYLKNSMAAAVSPLINMLAPAIDFVIDKVVALLNIINQLFARLSGASTFTAAKKQATSYGGAMSDAGAAATKAAKEIKDATLGIDELNIISPNEDNNAGSGGGGGGGGGVGSMFEELPISQNVSDFVDKLKAAFDAGDWKQLGTLLGEKVNEIINSIDWEGIGRKIGYFLNGAIQTAYWFLKTVDFENLGNKVASMLNAALEQIDFTYAGRLLVRWFTAGLDFLIGFIDGLDSKLVAKSIGDFVNGAVAEAQEWLNSVNFEKVGSKISTMLNDALKAINFEGLGYTIGLLVTKVLNFFDSAVTTFDWGNLGRTIADFINGCFRGIDLTKLVTTLQNLALGILTTLQQAIQNVQWYKIGADISNALNAIDWPKLFGNLAKTLSDAVKALLDAVLGLVETLDWEKLGSDLWKSLVEIITNIDWTGLVSKAFQLLGAVIGGATALFKGLVIAIWDSLKAGWNATTSYFDKFIDEAGGNVIKGLWNGIVNALKNVGSWIKENIFDPFIKGFKNAFGIHSPSTVMAEQGWNIVAGLWQGIKDKISSGIEVIKGWAGSVVEWFTKGKDGKGIVENFKELAGKIVSGFKDKVGSVYNTVKSTITSWSSKVKEWFTKGEDGVGIVDRFKETASNIVSGFKDKVGSTYNTVKTNVTTWASKVKEWFSNSSFGGVNKETFSTFANNTIEGFRDKIGSAYTNVKSNIMTWATKAKEWFTSSSFGGVNSTNFATFANNTIEGFKNKIGSAYTNVKSNIMTWASKAKEWFESSSFGGVNATSFATFANNTIEGFKNKIGSAYTNVKSNITTWATSVKSWFSDIASNSAFAAFATNVIDGFKNRIGGYYSTAKSNMDTFASNVKSWFTDKVSSSSFYQIASDVVEGFKNGIGALYTTCKNTITSWGSSIIEWFKGVLGINSPSRVFGDLAGFTITGYNNEIIKKGASTKGVINDWVSSFTDIVPRIKLAVDASALKYFDSSSFAKTVSASVNATAHTKVSADGFKEALEDFYREYLSGMADDVRRQADKDEKPIVQIGNRVITDAVTTQQKANGYQFVTP